MAISIIAFFLYLSSLIFQLLVEVLKLKKLRLVVKSEKRFQEIKQKKNEILQDLGLNRDDLKSFHKKLNGYM